MSEMSEGESRCDHCQRTFSNADALLMHRKAKHSETKPVETERFSFFKKMKIPILIVLVLGILASAFAVGVFNPKNDSPTTPYNTVGLSFPTGNVHWHADVDGSVCGEPFIMPNAPIVDHLLHTHGDQRIHLEGNATAPDQITVGKFMRRIGITFTQNEFNGKKVGENCPNGAPAVMTFLVNGQENTEFDNRVIRDGDKYTIRMEPGGDSA